MHTNTCAHMHIHTDTQEHTQIHIHMQPCIFRYMHTYEHKQARGCVAPNQAIPMALPLKINRR